MCQARLRTRYQNIIINFNSRHNIQKLTVCHFIETLLHLTFPMFYLFYLVNEKNVKNNSIFILYVLWDILTVKFDIRSPSPDSSKIEVQVGTGNTLLLKE